MWSVPFILYLMTTAVHAITFDITAKSHLCFVQDVVGNEDFTGMYRASPGYSQFIDFRVTEPKGTYLLSESGRESSEFHLKTITTGEYTFCFYNRVVSGLRDAQDLKRTVSFDLYFGHKAREFRGLARKQTLRPFEIELRFIEDSLREIHEDYKHIKLRQRELKASNDDLNAKALWLSVFSVLSTLLFAAWEASHLKKFFRSKQLID